MRENFKSGSVRGLIVTLEPILQYEVDYEPYLTGKIARLVGVVAIATVLMIASSGVAPASWLAESRPEKQTIKTATKIVV